MSDVQQGESNRHWLLRAVIVVAAAGAASGGLSLIGFKGGPVLIGGQWVSESAQFPAPTFK